MTKMQSARVNDRMIIAVSIKRKTLKMVSWVPITVIGNGTGEGLWRSRGWGQTILGAGLGEHHHTFSSIFDAFLSRNLNLNIIKMASPPDPALLLPPTVTTLSCAFLAQNCFNCFRNRTKVTTANVLLLLLPRFFAYFSLQTLQLL